MRKPILLCALTAFSLSLFANDQVKDVESLLLQTQIESPIEYKNTDLGYSFQLPSFFQKVPVDQGSYFGSDILDVQIFGAFRQAGTIETTMAVFSFFMEEDNWEKEVDTLEQSISNALGLKGENEFEPIDSLAPSHLDAYALRAFGRHAAEDELACFDLHLFEKEGRIIGIATLFGVKGQTEEQEEAFDPNKFTSLILKTLSFE